MNIINFILFAIFYAQQSVVLILGLKLHKLSGLEWVRGSNAEKIFLFSTLVGNAALGLFKGRVHRFVAGKTPIVIGSMFLQQLLFLITIYGVMIQKQSDTICPIYFYSHLAFVTLGMVAISATDSVMDNVSVTILGPATFALCQTVGQKVMGKISSSLVRDGFTHYPTTVLATLTVIAVFIFVGQVSLVLSSKMKTIVVTKNNSGQKSVKPFTERYSYFLFSPLLLILLEAFGLDQITSSIKYIYSMMATESGEQLLPETYVAIAEVLVCFLAAIYVKKMLSCDDNRTYTATWRKWSNMHAIACIVRIILILTIVEIIPVSSVSSPANMTYFTSTTSLSKDGSKKQFYAIGSSSVGRYAYVLLIGMFMANAAIDTMSSILVTTLFVQKASMLVGVNHSDLDGLYRFFTYLPVSISTLRNISYFSIYLGPPDTTYHAMKVFSVLYSLVWIWDRCQQDSESRNKTKVE